MTTTANIAIADNAWTAILTSADGTGKIEVRDCDMEFVYSDAAVSMGQVKGLTLTRTQLNPYGSMVVSQLDVPVALTSGMSLYARALGPGNGAVTGTAVVFKDTEAFGS